MATKPKKARDAKRRSGRKPTVSSKRKKALALLSQLQKAGARIVNVAGKEPQSLDELRAASALSKAALKAIETEGIDFTAWGAWTLRF